MRRLSNMKEDEDEVKRRSVEGQKGHTSQVVTWMSRTSYVVSLLAWICQKTSVPEAPYLMGKQDGGEGKGSGRDFKSFQESE